MHHPTPVTLLLAGLVSATAGAPQAARADVTIQQQTTFDFAFIKAHGSSTEYTTADKQRRDTELHCEGFMAMFCGNAQSAEVVRLDRDLRWELEPKKKEYRETAFPTAAQRQAAAQQAEETLAKMKECPAMQRTATAPDTSKCDLSPPRIDVKQTGTHAMFAGHDTQLTQLALTRSCTNKETGDVCDFVFALDSWLTQDAIAALAERKTFEDAYLGKLGVDPSDPAIQRQMRQFLAPYADTLKQLNTRAADFKGYPLKTAIRIAFGGEHCGAAKGGASSGAGSAGSGSVVGDATQAAGDAAAGSAANAAGSAAAAAATNAAGNTVGGSVLGSAASAFGSKLVGGLFNRKKPDSPSAGSAATSAGNGLPPGMVQAAQITIETTSIDAAAVPATQFDIPAGWTLIHPQASASKEFSCPKSGT